ncbi:MAG: glutathione transport system substrate-binding protein [Propionibacteriaceae bacterium]|nr:glutathione transport system substrate-binding protein [Propionibacteriaceae bacterium]
MGGVRPLIGRKVFSIVGDPPVAVDFYSTGGNVKARKLLAVPLLAVAMAMSACNTGDTGAGTDQPSQAAISAQDVNPQDRGSLQQGGTLRQAVSDFGNNWNPMNVNGNNADLTSVRAPMSVTSFDYNAEGTPTPNPNFLTSISDNGATPLVVTMKLNPKAVWGDGSPIDVDDWIATVKACNGEDKSFQCATTQGYDSIASVKAGADKFEVIVTFKAAYPDYTQVLSTVSKAESVADANTFNKGWTQLKNEWFTGPYKLDKYDATQKIVTLIPNDKWWGDKPLLDSMVYRAIDPSATAQAYVNNELDTFDIGPDPDAFAKAKTVTDGTIRKAAGPNFRHFTFNTKAGVLKDKVVRQAIVRGLDRQSIGESDLAGLDWPAAPLNNNVFVSTQEGYEDMAKATGIDFDVEKAKSDLDAAGWKAGADGIREKDGKKLEVKFAQLAGVPVSENEALQAQKQLADIGVKVNIVSVPISKFQDGTLLSNHEFELVAFSWIGTPYPFGGIKQIYGSGAESNYSQASIPQVDELIKQIDVENDRAKRAQMANEANKLIWEEVMTLPLYQRPELIAAKTKLANFGAVGLSTLRYENIGYQS